MSLVRAILYTNTTSLLCGRHRFNACLVESVIKCTMFLVVVIEGCEKYGELTAESNVQNCSKTLKGIVFRLGTNRLHENDLLENEILCSSQTAPTCPDQIFDL